MSKVPKKLSVGEETFARDCRAYNLEMEREYFFHPKRKFRFDFAFPAAKLGIEIEGVTHEGGRHQRIGGYAGDCVKYNSAVKLGWRVLRYTAKMVTAGTAIDDVLEVLKMDQWTGADRQRIALFKAGWSCNLIAEYRKESLADVVRSVNMLLEVLGEKLIEVD